MQVYVIFKLLTKIIKGEMFWNLSWMYSKKWKRNKNEVGSLFSVLMKRVEDHRGKRISIVHDW